MNELYVLCFGLAVIFFAFTLTFLIMGEKACNMVPGYNFKTLQQRKAYDEKKISRDTALFYAISGALFLLGGLGCYFWSDASFWAALALWVAYLLKYILYDRNKARFDRKYKRTDF